MRHIWIFHDTQFYQIWQIYLSWKTRLGWASLSPKWPRSTLWWRILQIDQAFEGKIILRHLYRTSRRSLKRDNFLVNKETKQNKSQLHKSGKDSRWGPSLKFDQDKTSIVSQPKAEPMLRISKHCTAEFTSISNLNVHPICDAMTHKVMFYVYHIPAVKF